MIQAAYREAAVDYRVLAPADVGLARIGHAGFFRASSEGPLWRLVLQWLDARLLPARPIATVDGPSAAV
jgi:predicted alpha/beta hydrolase